MSAGTMSAAERAAVAAEKALTSAWLLRDRDSVWKPAAPEQLLQDARRWGARERRLACCAVARAEGLGPPHEIEKAEARADGGPRIRVAPGREVPPWLASQWEVVLPQTGRAYRTYFGAICDVTGPAELPPLPDGWRKHERGLVLTMAAEIYAHRAWGDCPVLADLLAEAGCAPGPLLDHLRGPGPHARGCWAVDLLTDRLTRPRRGPATPLPDLDRPSRWEVLAGCWFKIWRPGRLPGPTWGNLSEHVLAEALRRLSAGSPPLAVVEEPVWAYRSMGHIWDGDVIVTSADEIGLFAERQVFEA